jgi:hypothetical protein
MSSKIQPPLALAQELVGCNEIGCDSPHCTRALREATAAITARDEAVREQAAAICDGYGREGDRYSKEYAAETADELATRIRALSAKVPR